MKYVLNSAVITAFGRYSYRPASVEEARQFIADGADSTIGYEETAVALSRLTGLPVAVNRRQIHMEPGDQALVFRLTRRLEKPGDKGKIGEAELVSASEIGILVRDA